MKPKKGIKPVESYQLLGNRRNLPRFLYHATKREYLESIEDFGLVRAFLKGIPGWYKDQDFIWLDTKPRKLLDWLKKYYPNWDWIIIEVNINYLETNKLFRKRTTITRKWGSRTIKDTFAWYIYKGDIPREATRMW